MVPIMRIMIISSMSMMFWVVNRAVIGELGVAHYRQKLISRYLILDVLGQGTFGQVVKCQNMRTHELFAVKVVKNKPAYLNQSKMEVAILELVSQIHQGKRLC